MGDRPQQLYHNQWLDAAHWAIMKAQKPLTQKEVWEKIQKHVKTTGKTPLNTLNANVNQAIKRGKVDFCRIGPGTWGLKSLGHDKQYGTVDFTVPSPCKWKVRSEVDARNKRRKYAAEVEDDIAEVDESSEEHLPHKASRKKEHKPPVVSAVHEAVSDAQEESASYHTKEKAPTSEHETPPVPEVEVKKEKPTHTRQTKRYTPKRTEEDESKDTLNGMAHQLAATELLDVLNYQVFSEYLTLDEQQSLLNLVSPVDVGHPPAHSHSVRRPTAKIDQDALQAMFSSKVFEKQVDELQERLRQGLLEMSTAAMSKMTSSKAYYSQVDPSKSRDFELGWNQHMDLVRQADTGSALKLEHQPTTVAPKPTTSPMAAPASVPQQQSQQGDLPKLPPPPEDILVITPVSSELEHSYLLDMGMQGSMVMSMPLGYDVFMSH